MTGPIAAKKIEPSDPPCRYARYCRFFSPMNTMCVGKQSNMTCPAACQFQLYNRDLKIDEEKMHFEGEWLL